MNDVIPILYNKNGAVTAEAQRAMSDWLDRNVIYNQTSLISDLLGVFSPKIRGYDGMGDVHNLSDNSVEAVEDFLTHTDKLSEEDRENIWNLPYDEREVKALQAGWEPEQKEIYEWWLVTPYFADLLDGYCEPIYREYACQWWGRCTTGQSYIMDHVIINLAIDKRVVQNKI
ncbi:MAG: hypothetical protein AAF296_02975 [Pseudomonadota bacterium]